MNFHNNNKLAEQVMSIATRKVRPMKVQTNNNITEQLIQIKNNKDEIQMGHCLKLPYTLGAMDVVCQFCGAIGFKSKKRNGQVSFGKLCCNGNKTHPGNLLKAPLHHNLVELITATTPQA